MAKIINTSSKVLLMRRLGLLPVFLGILLVGCQSETPETTATKAPETIESLESLAAPTIISEAELADCSFLTTNHEQQPVLSWVAGTVDSSFLFYSVFNEESQQFGTPIQVTPTAGISPHNEAMPKVAFRNDGTVIAVYNRSNPTEENRFAGAIYYSQSFDDGQTWTTPSQLHTDTSAGIGRSFVDIARLADGEIGAVWLDGRKRSRDGSTLCFTKTSGHDGFIADQEIAQTVCQCCRTDLYVANSGTVHIAYRDIFNDSIRDIAHLMSDDNGKVFSAPQRISHDNWIINGCPHTGPSIATHEQGVYFTWYTMGGGSGIYSTIRNAEKSEFELRTVVSEEGKHPQATSLPSGIVATAFEEMVTKNDTSVNSIHLHLGDPKGNNRIVRISNEEKDCSFPVLTPTASGNVLVAWTQRTATGQEVAYQIIQSAELKVK